MAKRYTKNQDQYATLKKRFLIALGIPLVFGLSFLFFGPQMSGLFVIFSQKPAENTDNLPPTTPIFANAPKAVTETTLRLDGFGEQATTVKLFVNGPEKATTVVLNDGTFTFEDIQLIRGRNTIYAIAVDSNNNESTKSETLYVNVDTDEPDLTITTPQDGDVIRNLNNRIEVLGEVNEKAEIRVNGKLAVLRPDMTFVITLGVNAGDVEIMVTATDEAGNVAEETLNVVFLSEG